MSETSPGGKQVISGFADSMGHGRWKGTGWRLICTVGLATARGALNQLAGKIASAAVAMVALGLLLAWGLVHANLGKPIRDLVAHFEKIAAGDLRGEVDTRRRDEIGLFTRAAHRTVGSLRSLIRDVAHCSEQVSGAATELGATSHELSQGSDAQHAAAEDTLGAVAKISAEMSSVSQRAEALARRASGARSPSRWRPPTRSGQLRGPCSPPSNR